MDITRIPDEMRKNDNWVGYRIKERNGKQTKIPYQLNDTDKAASSTNSETWGSYEDAIDAMATGLLDGIGFVFTKKAGLVGIDIDHCIDPDGVVLPHALEWINLASSYTEVSPSGTGFHIIIKGNLSSRKGQKKALGEIYESGRFFTVTGDVWDNNDTIDSNQSAIDHIYTEIGGEESTLQPALPLSLSSESNANNPTVTAFCNDVGCYELWNRRVIFSSQNEYDLAIASRAYMRGFTKEEATELIYQHRVLWNENPDKAKRPDYIKRTLDKASNVFIGRDNLPIPEPEPDANFFMDAAHLTNNPTKIKWLVKGYIPSNGLIWVFGKQSSYKTFIAKDMAYHIATGRDWCGCKVKQGNVIYIAGEGVGGLGKRLKGLELHYGEKIPRGSLKITKGAVFLNDPLQMANLKSNIRAIKGKDDLKIIIIDTKSANMMGSDSDSATMNDWINTVRQLELEFNVTIYVIDHVGHGDQDRMRGASQQGGAADAAYRIERPCEDEDKITFSAYKDPKDFESPPALSFYPKKIILPPDWNDEDGEPTSTLVMINHRGDPSVASDPVVNMPVRMTDNYIKALDEFNRLLNTAKRNLEGTVREPHIEYKHWLLACKDKSVVGKNYKRVCDAMITTGIINHVGVFVSLNPRYVI